VSATTDVILAAGPTVVAVVAIGANVWQQKRGFSHERELSDLAAVRSVLDDAALALQRVELPSGELVDRESRSQVLEARDELERIRSRIVVRFGGSHALAGGITDATEALRRWNLAATALTIRGVSHDKAEKSQDEAARMFRHAADAFLDAAAKTAGARLPVADKA